MDEKRKAILVRLAEAEEHHAERWAKRMTELGAVVPALDDPPSKRLRQVPPDHAQLTGFRPEMYWKSIQPGSHTAWASYSPVPANDTEKTELQSSRSKSGFRLRPQEVSRFIRSRRFRPGSRLLIVELR